MDATDAKRGKMRACDQRLVLLLLLFGLESGASLVNQSQSEVRKRELLSTLIENRPIQQIRDCR